MVNIKELEIQGCRKFVCPNLCLLDEKGKELNLKEETIKRSKNIAIDYFKKTYHNPNYSAKKVLAAILYIASILEGEKKSQKDIGKKFGVTVVTINKWYHNVMIILDIKKLEEERQFILSDNELAEIDKEGKALSLKDDTINRAKNIANRYFDIVRFSSYDHSIRQLWPAFIYTASIIENDKRTQLEICQVSGVSASVISKWYRDILRVLGMKAIYHNLITVSILEN